MKSLAQGHRVTALGLEPGLSGSEEESPESGYLRSGQGYHNGAVGGLLSLCQAPSPPPISFSDPMPPSPTPALPQHFPDIVPAPGASRFFLQLYSTINPHQSCPFYHLCTVSACPSSPALC